MDKRNPTIALVQQPPVFLNLQASVDKAIKIINEAASSADLIVFPETWLPGYPVWLDVAPKAGLWNHPPAKILYRLLTKNAIRLESKALSDLQDAVAAANICVVMGAHEKDGHTLYNTQFYFEQDGSYSIHRKLMPTYTERLIWGMGDGSTLTSMESPWGSIGGLICWEHWMPMARAAMHAKNESIHVAQWPYVKELHQLCSRHYAFEGQCFVAASGGIASKSDILEGLESLELTENDKAVYELIESIPVDNDERILKGGSALIAPDSNYIMEPVYDEAGIFYAEAPLNLISEGNLYMDSNGHYARPDVFSLNVDTAPKKNVAFSSPDDKTA
jgi:predicted amidohydrolase